MRTLVLICFLALSIFKTYAQPDGVFFAERFVFLDTENNPINFGKADTSVYSLKMYNIVYRIKGECGSDNNIGCEKIKEIKEKYKNQTQRIYEDNSFSDLFDIRYISDILEFSKLAKEKAGIIRNVKSLDARPKYNLIDVLHFNFRINGKEMVFRLRSEDYEPSKHLIFIRFREGTFEAIKENAELQFFEITDPEILKAFIIRKEYTR